MYWDLEARGRNRLGDPKCQKATLSRDSSWKAALKFSWNFASVLDIGTLYFISFRRVSGIRKLEPEEWRQRRADWSGYVIWPMCICVACVSIVQFIHPFHGYLVSFRFLDITNNHNNHKITIGSYGYTASCIFENLCQSDGQRYPIFIFWKVLLIFLRKRVQVHKQGARRGDSERRATCCVTCMSHL